MVGIENFFSMKKIIRGFDFLKFFMATMVALGHLKGLVELPNIEKFFLPFMGAAVPTFFVISAFLFWRKQVTPPCKKYCFRLLVLYICWHIVYSPLIIHKYVMGNSDGNFAFLRDFIFGYSLSGGWFVASLIWGMLLIYLLKKCKVHDLIIVLIAILSYLFVYMHEIFNNILLDSFYTNIQYVLNDKLIYSPFVSFPWVVMGYIMSKSDVIMYLEKNKIGNKIVVLIGISSMLLDMIYPDYWYLPTIPLTLSIFIYCYRLNLPESSICKYLRNYSIILFFVHFFFIRFIFEPKLLSFVVFYVASISIAMMIVYLSEKRHFKILNKLY